MNRGDGGDGRRGRQRYRVYERLLEPDAAPGVSGRRGGLDADARAGRVATPHPDRRVAFAVMEQIRAQRIAADRGRGGRRRARRRRASAPAQRIDRRGRSHAGRRRRRARSRSARPRRSSCAHRRARARERQGRRAGAARRAGRRRDAARSSSTCTCSTASRDRGPPRGSLRAGRVRLPRARHGRRAAASATASLERLLHVDGAPASSAWRSRRAARVVLGARGGRRDVAEEGDRADAIRARRRRRPAPVPRALPPRPADRRRACAARPQLRIRRRPEPFEALAWAVTEQLIEYRARGGDPARIVRPARPALRARPACATCRRRDARRPRPGRLSVWDLSAGRARRARARRRARSRPAASTCAPPTTSAAGARLRAIPGIGQWTVEVLALHGQGRYDHLPAGDLAYLKLVGPLPPRATRSAARDRGRGARAVRALRALGRARGAHALGARSARARCARPRRSAPGRVRAHVPEPLPGRNSFVSARPDVGGRVTSSLRRIQSRVVLPLPAVLEAERPARLAPGRRTGSVARTLAC